MSGQYSWRKELAKALKEAPEQLYNILFQQRRDQLWKRNFAIFVLIGGSVLFYKIHTETKRRNIQQIIKEEKKRRKKSR